MKKINTMIKSIYIISLLILICSSGYSQSYGEPIVTTSFNVDNYGVINRSDITDIYAITNSNYIRLDRRVDIPHEKDIIIESYLSFDPSIIPSNAVIVSATLKLYGAPEKCHEIGIGSGSQFSDLLPITNVSTALGASVSLQYSEEIGIDVPISDIENGQTQDYLIDVKNIVDFWFANPSFDRSFYLKMNNNYNDSRMFFYSSLFVNAAKWPKLEISYYIPYEPGYEITYNIVDATCLNGHTSGIEVEVVDKSRYDALDYQWYDSGNNPIGENSSYIYGLSPGEYHLDLHYVYGVANAYANSFDGISQYTFYVGNLVEWGVRQNVNVATENKLTKNSASDWDGGAVSGNLFFNSEGWAEFEYENTEGELAFGINKAGEEMLDYDYTNIDRGFYVKNTDVGGNQSHHEAFVIENGTQTQVVNTTISYQSLINLKELYRLEFDANGMRYYIDGTLLTGVNSIGVPQGTMSVKADIYTENAEILQSRASVECMQANASMFDEFNKIIDGGYYRSRNGKLRFKFDEEYDDFTGHVQYRIYNDLNELVTQGYTMDDLDPNDALAAEFVKYGDNRYVLNVASLAVGYYVLEIENTKKETWHLRFSVPQDGGWSEWHEQPCTTLNTCGPGIIIRTRECDNPVPIGDGMPCYGEDYEEIPCIVKPCPIDGNWNNWVTVAECPACGEDKTHIQQHLCNNPAPQFGGADCPGPAYQEAPCDIPCCVYSGYGSDKLWETITQLGLTGNVTLVTGIPGLSLGWGPVNGCIVTGSVYIQGWEFRTSIDNILQTNGDAQYSGLHLACLKSAVLAYQSSGSSINASYSMSIDKIYDMGFESDQELDCIDFKEKLTNLPLIFNVGNVVGLIETPHNYEYGIPFFYYDFPDNPFADFDCYPNIRWQIRKKGCSSYSVDECTTNP